MIGRKKEYQQLQEAYESEKGRLVIVSGREGVGKTTLLQEFAKDKTVYFYQAAECSGCEQRYLLGQAWKELYGIVPDTEHTPQKPAAYLELFQSACKAAHQKPVIILEDILWIARNDSGIYGELVSLLEQEPSVMVVLSASTLVWREEELKIESRGFISRITDRIFLEPFSFLEMVKYFPELPIGDIIQIYAILGGVPGYLEAWDTKSSISDNIIRLFLEPDAILAKEPVHYLKTTLRELSLYNTVLHAMSGGATRLNDIHVVTGFSRAKISVYMKNLKQLGVVDKVKTIHVKCRDQEIKGMYEITDPLIHFWYRFLYPNQSYGRWNAPEEFYQKKIQEELESYTAPYFAKVCAQYLDLMNRYQKLPIHYDRMGAWYGKDGEISLLAKDKEGKMILMQSKWQDEKFSTSDLEKILRYLMQSGMEPEYYYLFSKSDFETELRQKAEFVNNMILVDLNDL